MSLGSTSQPSQPSPVATPQISPALSLCLCSDGWQSDFKQAAQALSYSGGGAGSVGGVLSSLAGLEAAAKKGSLPDAQRGFVGTVVALQGWADAAGIASSLKGL